ncbi:myosin II light chain [Basidiobolus ranarum]|uniref:Myosin II light chain n=1 Tax=Basidiobolus ranarum TaxID=34480 RepID=A0ABR2X0Q7_9FUNG
MACSIANISEKQLTEFKEVFSLHDIRGDGYIPHESIGQLLRALGQNPTQAELSSIASAFGRKKIDFAVFLDILYTTGGFDVEYGRQKNPEAFEIFNQDGTGLISAGELRYVLTTLGEQLSEAEVNEFIRDVDINNTGLIDYNAFVNLLMSS